MPVDYFNVFSNKEVKVDTHENNHLNFQNAANLKILDAYQHEVNVFMHCHLRGYDKCGSGKEMVGHYYDKYGAPFSAHQSWSEGYRVIEEELAKHFRMCANRHSEGMPLVAGYGGGVHLYKPIKLHNEKPWNMTGWIPLESKWCCENRYFRNRYFFALRGNEVQNDLWDYHPYKSKDKDTGEQTEGTKYSQFVPVGKYEGGYWYYGDVKGRYLHIINLKDHQQDEMGVSQRYNYIVHPLAYRRNMKLLPDNSVDGMQWAITNVNNEAHFQAPDRLRKWGEKCHGLELFNDFTYYYSWQPENLDDKEEAMSSYEEIFNGTLMNYQKKAKYRYHYWFNSYPHEFGEFLLDSALSCGTYLHPVAANDAFYNRHVAPQSKGNPNAHTDRDEEEMEGMERVMMADPKGVLVRANTHDIQASDIGCNKRALKLKRLFLECSQKPQNAGKEDTVMINEMVKFLAEKPYHNNTIFGYTTLLDPKKEMHTMMENNCPPNLVEEEEDWNTGLNCIESNVMHKLQHGQFYAHTGVYDMFNYGEYEEMIPYQIHNQPTADKLCPEIFMDRDMDLMFTFPRVREEKKDKVWRYTIQVQDHDGDSSSVTTTQGYFKLDTEKRTVLDLSRDFPRQSVCWLRFTVFEPENPQRRAWFPPIRGPAFCPLEKTRNVPVENLDAIQPTETIRIANVRREVVDEIVTYKQVDFFEPYALTCANLEIVMNHCSEEEDDFIFSYFLQAYPTKQLIDRSPDSGTRNSVTDPNNPDESIIPRIRNSVHGFFQLCDEQPTKINLCESWDEKTVVGGKVYIYAISNVTGQPVDVSHLVLPGGLPPHMLLPHDQMK